MAGFLPPGMDIEAMLGQIAAAAPSSSSGQTGWMPPGFEGSGDPGGNVDWSWFTDLFKTSPGAHAAFNPRAGGAPTKGGQVDIGALFTASPADQLTQMILQKMGGANTGRGGINPYRIQIARAAAARAQHDAGYRGQLAGSLGWKTDNAHVQYWITNGGGLPSNPTQADKAIAGPKDAASGASAPNAALKAASTTKVSFPFPYAMFSNPNYEGNNYGDPRPAGTYWGGWEWHQGQDYGVPQGTQLSFPFAGQVTKVGFDPNGYGNYVTIQFGDQGLTMTYAHLQYVYAKQGDSVSPGQQIGLSGGSGPGSGISTGAHLLVVLQDARGHPLDPRPLLSAIYNNGNGTTLGALQNLGAGTTGVPSATNAQYEVTPDGKVLWAGTPDRAYYDLVADEYSKRYGQKPPFSIVAAMRSAGVENSSQMAAVAANWPSDIPGITFSQRDAIFNQANGIAMKEYGRPIPDSLVKQLATQGLVSPNDIKEWFDTHLPTDMPPAEYQQVYDAAMPAIQQAYGQGPSPEYIGYLWGKSQPQTTSPTAAATATAPAAPGVGTTPSPTP